MRWKKRWQESEEGLLTSSSKNETGEDERPVVGSRVDEREHQHRESGDDRARDQTPTKRESFDRDVLGDNHRNRGGNSGGQLRKGERGMGVSEERRRL